MFFNNRKKIGLALGGGAARGITHVGIIDELNNFGIPIDYIAGVSAGSIVGSVFCALQDSKYIVKNLNKFSWLDVAGLHFSKRSLVSSNPLESFIESHIGKITFKDLKIPFSAVATNILTYERVAINDLDTKVSLAVRASMAVPGVFPPVNVNGKYLIDGGTTGNVPVDIVRVMGADIVIAVDVIPYIKLNKLPRGISTLADRGLDITLHTASLKECQRADVSLYPVTELISSVDIKSFKKMINMGRKSVRENINEIKHLIQ